MPKILIKNGKVFDGTGSPWYKADVLVSDGQIEAVGFLPDAYADTVIDAEGLAVSPGFIDAHSHTDMFSFLLSDVDGRIIQGVTTEVSGMCGETAFPVEKFMARKNFATDLAFAVGHGKIRAAVMNFDDREPTVEELEQMKALLREAMELGAIGLSTGLIYPTGCFAKTDEIVELCKVVKEYGGIYVTHMRNEADELIPALEEAITIGRESGCKVEISHHKASGKQNHGKVKQTLEMMEKAREEGIDITCDAYPYTAGSTEIVTLFPQWVHEGGRRKLLGRLKDPAQRQKIKEEINVGVPGWENMYFNSGAEGILLCDLRENPEYEGKNLQELGELLGKDPVDALIDLMIDEDGDGIMACFSACEEDNFYVLQHRLTMVGSDGWGMPCDPNKCMGKPHPRCYGTFPRVLGVYARELGLFSMETAVWKMTGFPATRYGLKDRGFLAAGKLADVVIFDPETIIDKATYAAPWTPPEGIHYVIKNGEIVVEGKEYNHKGLGLPQKRRDA